MKNGCSAVRLKRVLGGLLWPPGNPLFFSYFPTKQLWPTNNPGAWLNVLAKTFYIIFLHWFLTFFFLFCVCVTKQALKFLYSWCSAYGRKPKRKSLVSLWQRHPLTHKPKKKKGKKPKTEKKFRQRKIFY